MIRRLYAVACDCCGAQALPAFSADEARRIAVRWGFGARRLPGALAAALGPQDRCPACLDHDEHPT